MSTYLEISIYIVISLLLSAIILGLSYIISNQKSYSEKVSAYECGFNPFDDARTQFDVKFYLVSILFIIFDLEVAYLFPWVISLKISGSLAFWSMMLFLITLTLGFIYEWKKGALEWD
uniref:NADH-ubiquinone oxidoreductase chain 3 n=1 Tax=Cyanoptyche gloeocystis TaxID=77922 RepID=A0A096Y6X4_9EUKA|nr:NADH dehydrogenase subunit 3 [Cyanoptyche gloeocystis]AIM52078.1 NADH dehydrogenase subunit 3 [Cyanoptyche gloeocystis]